MSKLLIDEPPLQVLPSLAVKFGLNEAIIIQQFHYWILKSDHNHNGHKWIYNSITNWREQFPFWSNRTIERLIKKLLDSNILLKDNFNKSKFDRTLWYTINYSTLSNPTGCQVPLRQYVEINTDNMTEPIPETTSETNSENQGDLFEEQKKDPLKTKEKKTYSECIKLTEAEYTKLIVKYDNSEAILKDYIEVLNDYKMSSGKKYDSDYHVMLRWVFKNFTEDKAKNNTNNNKNISDDDFFFE